MIGDKRDEQAFKKGDAHKRCILKFTRSRAYGTLAPLGFTGPGGLSISSDRRGTMPVNLPSRCLLHPDISKAHSTVALLRLRLPTRSSRDLSPLITERGVRSSSSAIPRPSSALWECIHTAYICRMCATPRTCYIFPARFCKSTKTLVILDSPEWKSQPEYVCAR